MLGWALLLAPPRDFRRGFGRRWLRRAVRNWPDNVSSFFRAQGKTDSCSQGPADSVACVTEATASE